MKITNNFTVNKIQANQKRVGFKTSPANDTFVKSNPTVQTPAFKGWFKPSKEKELKKIENIYIGKANKLTPYLKGEDTELKKAALGRLSKGIIIDEHYPILKVIATNESEAKDIRVAAIKLMPNDVEFIPLSHKLRKNPDESISHAASMKYLDLLAFNTKNNAIIKEFKTIFPDEEMETISPKQKELMVKVLDLTSPIYDNENIKNVLLPFVNKNKKHFTPDERLNFYKKMEARTSFYFIRNSNPKGSIYNAEFYKNVVLKNEDAPEIVCHGLQVIAGSIKSDNLSDVEPHKNFILKHLKHENADVQITAAEIIGNIGSREDLIYIDSAITLQNIRRNEAIKQSVGKMIIVDEEDYNKARQVKQEFNPVFDAMNQATANIKDRIPPQITSRERAIYNLQPGNSLIIKTYEYKYKITRLEEDTDNFKAGQTIMQIDSDSKPVLKQPNGQDVNIIAKQNPTVRLRTGQKLYIPGENTYTEIKLHEPMPYTQTSNFRRRRFLKQRKENAIKAQ